jgi:hypothetical protein
VYLGTLQEKKIIVLPVLKKEDIGTLKGSIFSILPIILMVADRVWLLMAPNPTREVSN